MIPRFEQEMFLKDFFALKRSQNNLWGNNNFFLDSGSSALIYYFRHICSKQKLTVGIPAYSCPSIANAVLHSNHNIRFIDLIPDSSGYYVPEKDLEELDALIFINFFGFTYDSLPLLLPKSKMVIADNSHCLPFLVYGGVLPEIFSFSLHKPLSLGIGGMIYIPEVLRETANNAFVGLRKVSPLEYLKRSFIAFIKSFCFNSTIYSCIKSLSCGSLKMVNRPTGPKEPLCMPDFFSQLVNSKIRRLNFNSLYSKLPRNNRLPINSKSHILSYYPIFFENSSKRDRFVIQCKKNGIEAFMLWENLPRNLELFNARLNSFPKTSEWFEHTIFLPRKVFKNKILFSQIMALI